MKPRFLTISLFFLLIAMATGTQAQRQNILSIPDLSVKVGTTMQLPINVTNTDEIVALQFDITFPSQFQLINSSGEDVTTDRCSGHEVAIVKVSDNTWRCIIWNEDGNVAFRGQKGAVVNLKLVVGNALENNTDYEMTLSECVLAIRNGDNVLTEAVAGKLHVEKLPDLVPSEVRANASNVAPGEPLSVSWIVKNEGDMDTQDGWTEQVSLVTDTQTKLLTTLSYDNALAANVSVSRSAEVMLPEVIGLDGAAYIQVRLVPTKNTGEPVSAQGNNSARSSQSITVSKKLILQVPSGSVNENATSQLSCKLQRSGSWADAQTFTLNVTSDSRISAPTSVIIPAGQSGVPFYITLTNDNVFQGDDVDIVVNASGGGYNQVTSSFTLVDDDLCGLTLTAPKSIIVEGETIEMTLTAEYIMNKDTEVKIMCEQPDRFTFPLTVTIPAGSKTATFAVAATEDDIPAFSTDLSFIAYGERLERTEKVLLLEDNDMPVLTLELTPSVISESAGPVVGVLRRTENTNTRITIKLSDDSDGDLYYGTQTLEMAKGVDEIHFSFNPIDNNLVDGDRTITITAAVWVSSCSCSAAGESAGTVSAQLQVLDNDGPSLQLSSSVSTLKEGEKVVLTIERNTSTDTPLNVRLVGDNDDLFEPYDHDYVILAEERMISIELTSKTNLVNGDSFTTVFTATADGFSSGTCWLMVTDQSLPDGIIENIYVDREEVEVNSEVEVSIVVANVGLVPLPAGTMVTVYAANTQTTLQTSQTITVGMSEILTTSVTMPETIGLGRIYAVVDEANLVKEQNEHNNTSPYVAIKTIAPFTASVSVAKPVYKRGEAVNISGQLSGLLIAHQNVEVYIINESARMVVQVETDDTGSFSTEWTPYENQFGHFSVGACFVGENLCTEMASFDVYGMKLSKRYAELYTTVDETYTGSVTVTNSGVLDLTGLQTVVQNDVVGLTVDVEIPSELKGGENVILNYTVHPSVASKPNTWDTFIIRITTAEGASLDFMVKNYAQNPVATLVSDEKNIHITIAKNSSRDYPVALVNNGKGNSGIVTLSLPEGVTCVTGNTLQNMQPQDTATVVLRFHSTEKMQLNVPVSGTVGINCQNGNGTQVNFEVTPVSEEMGTLIIDVCDEYTYNTDEAPHVEGASVIVTNPVTNALVVQGVTSADGLYTVTLPEGYYKVTVTDDRHDSYQNNIYVEPGTETRKTINLSVQAITVNFEVQEKAIEDKYEIITVVQYETNVPVPVVELTVPSKIDADLLNEGESLIFYATLTNKGLITAQDAELLLPEGFINLTFEPLTEYTGLTITPQQSIIIPVKVTRVVNNESKMRKEKPIDDDPCVGYPGTLYFWDCGLDRKWHRYKVALQLGSCNSNDPSTWDGGTGGGGTGGGGTGGGTGGGLSRPVGGGGSYYGSSVTNNRVSTSEDKGCEPCQNQFLIDLVDCGLSLVPAYRVLKAILNCGSNSMKAYKMLRDHNASADKKIGTVLEAVATCAAARHAGRGDKNATREKQREEAIESIIETLGQLVGQIGQGDDSGYKSWDGVIDNIGSLASSISSLAGFDFDNLEEMFCPLKLFKPCDKESSEASSRVQRRTKTASQPSYVTELQRSMSYGLVDMMALTAMETELYGSTKWLGTEGEVLSDFMATFQILQSDDCIIDSEALQQLLAIKPSNLSEEDVRLFVERWNNTVNELDTDNKIDMDKIYDYFELTERAEVEVISAGYADIEDCISVGYAKALDQANEASNSVCSTITLQIKQELVLTRQAFEGTLTVFNGHESEAMTDVKLYLTVTSHEGNVATSREFEIHGESLDGFVGDVNLTSGWALDAQKTGVSTILFIPTKYAAPTEPVDYSFGGYLTYVDPFTGLEVTRILAPITMTVRPTPVLELDYFVQRNIIGDDALTLDVVEPCEPAEFALLINNKGYGEASDVKMFTHQPEIIKNDKGLLNNFYIESSQLNGKDKILEMSDIKTTDFGTIPAQSQAYAQWWLHSDLLGHFTKYDVTVNHVTSFDNESLSLVEAAQPHELIHGFTVATTSDTPNLRGFLVNEIEDADDMPDSLYFTNATQASVSIASAAIARQSDMEYMLNIISSQDGWNYGVLSDPTVGKQKLVAVVRQSDGSMIPTDNVWRTDRTLRDGKDPLYENLLHFVLDMGSAQSESYLLIFEPQPEIELAVIAFDGTNDGERKFAPVEALTVTFNKPIKPETFTTDDIDVMCQGQHIDVSEIQIAPINDTQYQLTMSTQMKRGGYYLLNVQTAGITDVEGFNGTAGKSIGWNQYESITLTITDAGVATLILPWADWVRDGMSIYTCDGAQSSELLNLVENEDVKSGDRPIFTAYDFSEYDDIDNRPVIEANTPYLVKGVPGIYEFWGIGENTQASYTVGWLTGVLENTLLAASPENNQYVLQNKDGRIGFYRVDNVDITVPAYRVYLTVPEESAAHCRAFFLDDVETGIATPINDGVPCAIYDLQGRRVITNSVQSLSRGIYIVGGHKVFIP